MPITNNKLIADPIVPDNPATGLQILPKGVPAGQTEVLLPDDGADVGLGFAVDGAGVKGIWVGGMLVGVGLLEHTG